MVLEATMIIVDNSESSRNGDYLPNRFAAQSEATTLIFNAKTQSNPESAVGLMSMGGPSPSVLVTPTTDLGAILGGLHSTKVKGKAQISTALSIAALALKHRQNKSQRQRIVCFTCSSIAEDDKELVKLAKKMKKNNISVDFVAFGDLDSETKDKLAHFNEAVNGGDGSYLAIIPPSGNLLSDGLLVTPIIGTAGGSAPNGDGPDSESGGAGGGGFDFGVDPTADPDLAMALRMSMEEEENRLQRERREREAQEQSTRMEAIPEEGAAGHAASDAGDQATNRQPTVEDEKKEGGGEGNDPDRMDTA